MKLYYEDHLVGTITIEKDGLGIRGHFSYAQSWLTKPNAFPVSLSIPLSSHESSHVVSEWIGNLLPEGEQVERLTRNLRQSHSLSLISFMGRDTAGALRFGPAVKTGRYVPLSESALEKILNELPAKPFLAGDAGVSMSLAGAQYKLPVALFDNQMFLPLDGAASTHIIKPDTKNFFMLPDNEALCLDLAGRVLHNKTKAAVRYAGKRSYLLVERFDRIIHAHGIVERIHQEDFCQSLGLGHDMKYETEHNARMAKQIGSTTASLSSLFRVARSIDAAIPFLDAVIFNTMIGNVDAHAKNYSVLLSHGAPRFAPLYDTLCCAVYAQEKTGRLSQNMSQKIGGRLNPNTLRRAHWERFADDVDLPRATVFDALKSVESAIRHHADIMMNEAGHSDYTRSILSKIDRKARHVAALGTQITKFMQAKQDNKNQYAQYQKDPQP